MYTMYTRVSGLGVCVLVLVLAGCGGDDDAANVASVAGTPCMTPGAMTELGGPQDDCEQNAANCPSMPGSYATPQDVPLKILVPAFATSELKSAFQIGFLIFIPFVIIDLVVASALMSMGMMMLSPVLISLPFKIMLFVLVDGWALVMGTLAASFYR